MLFFVIVVVVYGVVVIGLVVVKWQGGACPLKSLGYGAPSPGHLRPFGVTLHGVAGFAGGVMGLFIFS